MEVQPELSSSPVVVDFPVPIDTVVVGMSTRLRCQNSEEIKVLADSAMIFHMSQRGSHLVNSISLRFLRTFH